MINLRLGDCVAFAREYRDEPFHALLCDPPYEIGFMGRDWDKTGIAFNPETWAAFSNVMYDGAFGMAFASARGWHRMAVAIEDAGFVIHPSIFGWSYGCLSEDTEILTIDGWKSYKECLCGSMVACYNVKYRTFDYMPVQEIFEYEYDEIAYRIQSKNTDQLVSRNHRVLVERNGEPCFEFAELLKAKEKIYQATPAQQNELQLKTQTQGQGDYVSRMWDTTLQAFGVDKENKVGRFLFQVLPRQIKRAHNLVQVFCQRQGEKESEKGIERCRKSSVERWSNLLSQTWQLCTNQIRSVSRRIFTNGTQRWVCDGTSAYSGTSNGTMFETFGSSASCQSQSPRQSDRKLGIVREQYSAQDLRTLWHASPDLATVTPVHYRGKVWCVKVPTGAFVARRNGKAFVTGNSGFPKATRIDTQVDKAAGNHRPDKLYGGHIGMGKQSGDTNSPNELTSRGSVPAVIGKGNLTNGTPIDPLARVWVGHRYGLQALKPALEPIIVFQKPYRGKPVENITRTGAGALWIDGTRIGTEQVITRGGDKFKGEGIYQRYNTATESRHQGRWASNFILHHHPDCGEQCVDGCAVKALDAQSGERPTSKPRSERGTRPSGFGNVGHAKGSKLPNGECYGDSGGASRFFFNVQTQIDEADPVFYCAKASRKERDAGLYGMPKYPAGMYAQDEWSRKHMGGKPADERTPIHNPHTTVKPIALTRYLATLLLPPIEYAPRRLFVPFAGVASEIIGAHSAGWDEIVGVESASEYIPIAESRLDYWINKNRQLGLSI